MSGFTIRQLEIFARVVEHGSFRRCADQLGVSQVSISEHVRELETRLVSACSIVTRAGRHIDRRRRTGPPAYRCNSGGRQ